MQRAVVLGLSGSLRNARSKGGARLMVDELSAIDSREALDAYLAEQANTHLEQFKAAGRDESKPFDELYRNLKKVGGHRGMSNSEIALAAALWGAKDTGADIDTVPLHDYFNSNGEENDLDDLKARLRGADAIILSTPVYFGDRGSLAQRLIDVIQGDPELMRDLTGKLYAGVAVGAKRNGGQETTLIYAMADMLNAGFLTVGNDSKTTSQYGGTGHAGDIGTMPADKYGIDTAIGTGRRIAAVASELSLAREVELSDAVHMDVWMLQDRDAEGQKLVEDFTAELSDKAQVRILDMNEDRVRPCIACDICPTHVGPDDEYRCIVRNKDDGLVIRHQDLLNADVLVPTIFAPKDRSRLRSVYQQFIERTRYLRRGDYVFTDLLVAPIVITEVGVNDAMDIRMMTSFIRHHTVIVKPVIAMMHEGKLLNPDDVRAGLARAVEEGRRLAAGRLASASLHTKATDYKPVGYVLATAKDNEQKTIDARLSAVEIRAAKAEDAARVRLASTSTDTAKVRA